VCRLRSKPLRQSLINRNDFPETWTSTAEPRSLFEAKRVGYACSAAATVPTRVAHHPIESDLASDARKAGDTVEAGEAVVASLH
jgi:hypothetical protein